MTGGRFSLNISRCEDIGENVVDDDSQSELDQLKSKNLELISHIETLNTSVSKYKSDITHLQESLSSTKDKLKK